MISFGFILLFNFIYFLLLAIGQHMALGTLNMFDILKRAQPSQGSFVHDVHSGVAVCCCNTLIQSHSLSAVKWYFTNKVCNYLTDIVHWQKHFSRRQTHRTKYKPNRWLSNIISWKQWHGVCFVSLGLTSKWHNSFFLVCVTPFGSAGVACLSYPGKTSHCQLSVTAATSTHFLREGGII